MFSSLNFCSASNMDHTRRCGACFPAMLVLLLGLPSAMQHVRFFHYFYHISLEDALPKNKTFIYIYIAPEKRPKRPKRKPSYSNHAFSMCFQGGWFSFNSKNEKSHAVPRQIIFKGFQIAQQEKHLPKVFTWENSVPNQNNSFSHTNATHLEDT